METSPARADISERVTIIEHTQSSVIDSVNRLADKVSRLDSSIDEVVNKLSQIGRATFREVIGIGVAVGGFLLVLFAGIWGLAIAPITTDLKDIRSDLAALQQTSRESVADRNTMKTEFREKLREIETQFRAMSMVINEQLQYQERLNDLFFKPIYGHELKHRTVWPQFGRDAMVD